MLFFGDVLRSFIQSQVSRKDRRRFGESETRRPISKLSLEILAPHKPDKRLHWIDVGRDKFARLDHCAVFQNHPLSLSLLDQNPLYANGFDVIDTIVRHHVCQVVAEGMRRATAQLRVDYPSVNRWNQITRFGSVYFIHTDTTEKAN